MNSPKVFNGSIRWLQTDVRSNRVFTNAIRILCLLSIVCSLPASGQYALDSFAVGAGNSATGGTYVLDANIGEWDSAASLSGGTYSMDAGFWGVAAIQTPDAPELTILATTTNTVVVSWPAMGDDFELQQASNLTTPSWSTAPQTVNTSGSTRFAVVNPPVGNRFYRLNKPNVPNAFEVVNLNNAGVGSLRAAIQSATNNATVTFAPGLEGLIVLNSELAMNKNLSITGPGATVLAVSGGNSNRVFNISGGNVKISGLTIRDGVVVGVASGSDAIGGGIFNAGNLSLSDCAVVANLAHANQGANGINANGGSGGNGVGGGIYNTGNLALASCTLALNEARGGYGGLGGDRNDANAGYNGGSGGGGLGGAICNDGSLAMTNCTFALNRVTGGNGGNGGEGGLFRGRGGNGGGGEGAGVLNRMNCQSANVTITSGVAERGGFGAGVPNGTIGSAQGGGFRTTTATAFLVNSLIAQNSLGSSLTVVNGFDVSGIVVSQGYNLVGITNGSSGWLASDKVGNDATPLNPLLDVLQDNGGATPTVALLPGSPAIDQGKAISLTTDQRGLPRPHDWSAITNAAGGNGSDIGAFELFP